MKTLTVVGALIAHHRELAGMNQPQLAKRLRVDQSTVSHWEADRRSPSPANLKRLCKVLDVKPADLIGQASDDPDSASAA